MFRRKKKDDALRAATLLLNSQYGKVVQMEEKKEVPHCEHGTLWAQISQIQAALRNMYRHLNVPLYGVRKQRTYNSYDGGYKYEVYNQITGDVHTSFNAALEGKLLAKTLCEALNASKRKALEIEETEEDDQ